MNRIENAMLLPVIVSAMTGGAAGYAMQQIMHGHSRNVSRGVQVTCRVCGAAGVTLYKDTQGRICKPCRDKVMEVVT